MLSKKTSTDPPHFMASKETAAGSTDDFDGF
jgi:hypothetical protein